MRSLVPMVSLALLSCSAVAVPQQVGVNRIARSSSTPTGECFTLKTYAPQGRWFAHTHGLIEKQYVPQRFALRSTCAAIARMELLPSSTHKEDVSAKKLLR